MARFYVLYDGRACRNTGTDKAAVLVAGGKYKEIIKDATDTFKDAESALYSYKNENSKLTDERWEQDFHHA